MSLFKRKVKAKMNSSKAMCLMGFGITANVDDVLGEDPKETLNRAIFAQMQSLLVKKRESIQEKVNLKKPFTIGLLRY